MCLCGASSLLGKTCIQQRNAKLPQSQAYKRMVHSDFGYRRHCLRHRDREMTIIMYEILGFERAVMTQLYTAGTCHI